MIDPSFLRKRKPKWRFFVEALLLHILVGIIALFYLHVEREKLREDLKNILSVRQVTQKELDRIIKDVKVAETEIPNEQQKDIERGQKAMLGEQTQRVKKETKAKQIGSVKGGDHFDALIKKLKSKEPENILGRNLKPSEKSTIARGRYQELDSSYSVSAQTFLNTDQLSYQSGLQILQIAQSVNVFWQLLESHQLTVDLTLHVL